MFREKIVSLILWAIKLFELTMGAHIIWRLKKVLKDLCFWCVADSLKILHKVVHTFFFLNGVESDYSIDAD